MTSFFFYCFTPSQLWLTILRKRIVLDFGNVRPLVQTVSSNGRGSPIEGVVCTDRCIYRWKSTFLASNQANYIVIVEVPRQETLATTMSKARVICVVIILLAVTATLAKSHHCNEGTLTFFWFYFFCHAFLTHCTKSFHCKNFLWS